MVDGWKILRVEIGSTGEQIELRYRSFGKGKAKIHRWEVFADDTKVNYAVNEADAEANFRAAVDGDYRHPTATTPAQDHWMR